MSVDLKPHNQEAYEKVKKALTEGNKTAVIHPTGTGKSYIAIKLIEENPESRFLYLAPWNSILYQLKENIINSNGKMLPNIKRMTYTKFSSLSEEEKKKLNVDYIVLDEFHHCGSPIWGKAIEDFIEENTDVKTLGLSATPIRYFDGNVDMAEKLFGNNIASEISFEEAVEQGILPEYDYVSALYGYEKDMKLLKEIIDSADSVAPSKKEEAIRLFKGLQTQLSDCVENLPEILNKHMQNKDGKYVIFCKNLEDMQEKIQEAQKMFSKVNPDMAIYSVSSLNSDNENERILRSFSKDTREGKLKLIFSVNMLNEGFHLPDIDGVVMMRPTKSPTIYKQQLGRALSVSCKNGKRPVIIDLVDNFDSIEIIEDLAERLSAYKGNSKAESCTKKKFSERVRAYDYVRDISETVKKLEIFAGRKTLTKRKSLSIDEKINLFEKYINENGNNIITDTVYEGYPIGVMLIQMRSNIKRSRNIQGYSPEQIEKLTRMGLLERKHESTIDEKVARLEAFCINNSKWWYLSKSKEPYLEESVLADIDEQERKNLIEQLKLARKDYEYIYSRKLQGKLPDDYSERLRQAGVGKIFGYKDEIEDLGRQYEKKLRSSRYNEKAIENKVTSLKNYLYIKDMMFGGLDNFRKAYVETLINGDIYQLIEILQGGGESAEDFFIKQFDVSSPDFINQTSFISFVLRHLHEDCDYRYHFFNEVGVFNVQDIKEKVLSTLTEEEAKILDLKFGLTDGKRRSHKKISEILDVTPTRIEQLEIKAIRKFWDMKKHMKKLKNIRIDLDREEQFIRKFFEHHDIFSFADSEELDEKVRSELLEIYNEGIREREREIKKEEAAQKEFESEVDADRCSVEIIEDLGICRRIYKCLRRAGINTVGDLLALSEEEMKNIPHLGDWGFADVLDAKLLIEDKLKVEKDKQDEKLKRTKERRSRKLKKAAQIIFPSEKVEAGSYYVELEDDLQKAGINTTEDLLALSEILKKIADIKDEKPEELQNEDAVQKGFASEMETKKAKEINIIKKQQARIAEQEQEISELQRKKNAHEQK